MPLLKGVQLLADISRSDGGRGNLIRILYEHPGGISQEDIRRKEVKRCKKRFANFSKSSRQLREERIPKQLAEFVSGNLAYEKDRLLFLCEGIRVHLDHQMEQVRQYRPEAFAQIS